MHDVHYDQIKIKNEGNILSKIGENMEKKPGKKIYSTSWHSPDPYKQAKSDGSQPCAASQAVAIPLSQ